MIHIQKRCFIIILGDELFRRVKIRNPSFVAFNLIIKYDFYLKFPIFWNVKWGKNIKKTIYPWKSIVKPFPVVIVTTSKDFSNFFFFFIKSYKWTR